LNISEIPYLSECNEIFSSLTSRCHSTFIDSFSRSIPPSKESPPQSAISFSFQFPVFFLRSPSSCLRLLPYLAINSILPSIFPSITWFRKQFLRKVWPIQLAFCLYIVCRIFLSSFTLCNTSSFLIWSFQPIFSILHQNTAFHSIL